MKKTLFLITFVLFLTTTLTACNLPMKQVQTDSDKGQANPTLAQLAPSDAQPTTIEITAWENGQTALALLESVATVQKKDYDFGVFIEGINGLLGDKDNYWAFYVNNEYAQRGADQTVLSAGDVVRFVYEPVSASPMLEESEKSSL